MSALSRILCVVVLSLSLLGVDLATAADPGGQGTTASEIRVAVASNFLPTLRELVSIYEVESGDRVKIIAASTGKLYAQIIHGAPFDIFLSADSRRPVLLAQSGHALESSRFTYALGKIVLWGPQPAQQQRGGSEDDCRARLERGDFMRLAIANPKTAPYGLAAQQLLENLGLWQELQPRLVRGENIAQTRHYVESGNAQLGIIALSLIKPLQGVGGCLWEPPTDLYQPIKQQAVRLQRTVQVAASERFMAFLRSPRAVAVIRQSGYGVE